MTRTFPFILGAALLAAPAGAGNPIIANQGVNDPHIRIFGNTAYLYASHDKSEHNEAFIMEDWQVWSSPDLVNWTLRSTLDPNQTYLADQPDFTSAWATDIAERDGRWFWYFSEGNRQTGVVTGPSPVGPWTDPLGAPLLTEDLTPTHEYDPGLYAEGDERYIVFGVWDYYLARLDDDMISLAEEPRKMEIRNPRGPYTFVTGTPFDGKPTDDKPFLHKNGDLYYLSWGAFYATSENLYGPYDYRGVIITDASFPTGLDTPTWPTGPQQGRHGSFFSWHGQDYFAYCDISQGGNRYFRDTFISYVHYREDGSIAPIRVDLTGVGGYDAGTGAIEAEEFFKREGFAKSEDAAASNGFTVMLADGAGALEFPNIRGLAGKQAVVLTGEGETRVAIRRTGAAEPITEHPISLAKGQSIRIPTGPLGETESLRIEVSGGAFALDTITFD